MPRFLKFLCDFAIGAVVVVPTIFSACYIVDYLMCTLKRKAR